MSGSEGGDERSDNDSEDEDDDSDDDDDDEMEMEENVAKPSEERGVVDSSQERASESREREDDWLVEDIPGEGDAEGGSPGLKNKLDRL